MIGLLSVPRYTDRSDFYHQIAVSPSCCASNIVGPAMPLSMFQGTSAYALALEEELARRKLCREVAGDGLGLESKPSLLGSSTDPCVAGAFSSLLQGTMGSRIWDSCSLLSA